MTNLDYETLADNTLLTIEESLDQLEADIDYENTGGVLTLTFENQSKIVINKQPAVEQIWIAAKAGGFHLNYDPGTAQWQTTSDKEDLETLLSRLCSQQAQTPIHLDLQ